MPVIYPINLAIFMVQYLTRNFTRHAKLGQPAPYRTANVVNGPAGDARQIIHGALYLGEVATGRLTASSGEHEAVVVKHARQLGKAS